MRNWRDYKVGLAITANQEYVQNEFMWNVLNVYKPKQYAVLRQNLHIKSASLNAHLWEAKRLEVDKILFMDTDMEFPLNVVQKLLSHDKPIVSGLYHTKVPPYSPIAGWTKEVDGMLKNVNGNGVMWKENYCPLPEDELVEVDWCGIGCLMVDMDVFDKIKYPCFKDVWDDEAGTRAEGHDVVFCRAVKDVGYSIYVDTSMDCGHKVVTYADSKWVKTWHKVGFEKELKSTYLEWTQENPYWNMQWNNPDGIVSRGPVKDELQRVIAYVPDGVRVADLACGGGFLLSILKDGADCDVMGYEFSQSALDLLKEKGVNGQLADIRTYKPGPDERYHTVIMSHILEHMKNDELGTVLGLAKSMAEEQVIISVPCETVKWIEHAQQFDEDSFKELLERYFNNVEITKIDRGVHKSGRVPYNLVARCGMASESDEVKLAATG